MIATHPQHTTHKALLFAKYTVQGSPRKNLRLERMGVAWAGFVTTSILLVATSSRNMSVWGALC